MSRMRGSHDIDRDLPEFLQEMRVTLTGAQVLFAFLFSVAFAPRFTELDDGQRTVYGWTLIVMVASITCLVAPVAVHQWNFGRGLRPAILVVTHVSTIVGLGLLAAGMVMALWLISAVVFPDSSAWIPMSAGVIMVLGWVGLPVVTWRFGQEWRVSDRDDHEKVDS